MNQMFASYASGAAEKPWHLEIKFRGFFNIFSSAGVLL